MFFSQLHITNQLQCTIHPTLGHINNLHLKGSNITLPIHSRTSHQLHNSWDKTKVLYFWIGS